MCNHNFRPDSVRDSDRAIRTSAGLSGDGTSAARNGGRSALLSGARLRAADAAGRVVSSGYPEYVQYWARLWRNDSARVLQSA